MSNAYTIAERWNDVRFAIDNKKRYPAAFDRVYIGKLHESNVRRRVVRRKRSPIKETDRRLRSYFILSGSLADVYLTKREAQVLYFICHGATNRAVAEKMGLSARTTEYYIKNIRKKTSTGNKRHLIRCVVETDFLLRLNTKELFADEGVSGIL